MPKMKTKSSAKKRFKFLGNGKVKRTHSHLRHILTKKTTKQNVNYSGHFYHFSNLTSNAFAQSPTAHREAETAKAHRG